MKKLFPILYWPKSVQDDTSYQLARKAINTECGKMPDVIKDDIDLMDVLAKNMDAVIYYPVFYGSTGWWGELLGGNAYVTNKIIVSSECQLMEIQIADINNASGKKQLMAAEISPSSGFFKKMNSSIATVSDMLATDSGTVLALFLGENPAKFINVLESTGNSYLGCIGRY